MEAVCRAFCETPGRQGLVLGVLPAAADDPRCSPPPGYPNPWVELAVQTHLPLSGPRGLEALSRNHINVLTCDVLVALAGGEGTLSELLLAVRYGRPVVAFLDSPQELPRLPSEVPWSAALADVQRFVQEHLPEPFHSAG